MKMMPYGVAAALLLGGSLLAPQAQAWQSGADSQSSSVHPADSGSQSQLSIRDLQQELKQDGFYEGSIDGIWGSESRSAMEQYQRQHALTPSGQLDRDTLQAMRSDQGAVHSGGSGLEDSSRDVGIGGSGMTGPSSDLGASGSDRLPYDQNSGSTASGLGGSSDEEQR
jgi:peptidoglycan hydrolase-like protein with peptidoglycan-binding domain